MSDFKVQKHGAGNQLFWILRKEANLAEQLRTITKASVELQMLENGERTSRLVSETDYGAED